MVKHGYISQSTFQGKGLSVKLILTLLFVKKVIPRMSGVYKLQNTRNVWLQIKPRILIGKSVFSITSSIWSFTPLIHGILELWCFIYDKIFNLTRKASETLLMEAPVSTR